MNIYINGRFLSQRITGVQRYALEITRALDRAIASDDSLRRHNYCLLTPPGVAAPTGLEHIAIRAVGHLHGHPWEQLELPLYVRDGYLLNLCNCAPLAVKNQLVTIHDAAVAAFPSAYSRPFRLWYRLMYSVLGRRLTNLDTVSHFSASELNHYFGIHKEKFTITYNGIDHIARIKPDDSVIERHGLTNTPYVFAVSSLSPSKNFALVLQAASIMPEVTFIIAGGANASVFSAQSLAVPENVRFIGYVTDGELIALYRHAAAFVYPSLYEGFGIPPLEAMACSCPVVVSNAASLPEVCGDAALYIDPTSADELVTALTRLLADASLRQSLVSKGCKQSAKFTWDSTISPLLDILKVL